MYRAGGCSCISDRRSFRGSSRCTLLHKSIAAGFSSLLRLLTQYLCAPAVEPSKSSRPQGRRVVYLWKPWKPSINCALCLDHLNRNNWPPPMAAGRLDRFKFQRVLFGHRAEFTDGLLGRHCCRPPSSARLKPPCFARLHSVRPKRPDSKSVSRRPLGYIRELVGDRR
jgi:hypothetical protein